MGVTHEVTNQVPPLAGHDPIAGDAALAEACRRHAGQDALDSLKAIGALAGSEQAQDWGRLANENPPRLRSHDRYGHRVDEVEFHPAWHELMRTAFEHGLGGAPWAAAPSDHPTAVSSAHPTAAPSAHPAAAPSAHPTAPAAAGEHPHVRRAVGYLGWTQVEMGHACPVTMTYAVVPALRAAPELAARYEPGLTAPAYEFGLVDPAGKRGLVAGMGMTEKQGGSDVRTNTTRAVPQPDGTYALTGHKWFTSAPMSDLFLVLAQLDEGVSCFLVPRVLPDGTRNVFRLQRLKDKLGDRSNASSEVEFEGTTAELVGEPGRGVPTIIEMVNMTRLDCTLGSAATVRAALTQAIHHARHRRAFGALLADQPLMQNVLADLAVESEAATALAVRLAAAVDAGESAFLRLAGAAAKYWVCKRTPAAVAEALEVLGGNGYVEESGLPRLYRQAPLNSIWEGSGNVIALDVLRALGRSSEALAAVRAELDLARGADRRYDAAVARLSAELADPADLPVRARRVAGLLALCLQGSLLLRWAPPETADAFCATRLGGNWSPVLGTLPAGTPLAAIVDRAAVSPV
ncbi:acyl-CoA dehydrogenase family protein [Geodermatophilus sabuli]|uniref:Putative acyl-CoA dehydrogenase n=1 Tax=Geodermatophilus sabuli TaxID=1564158 RepID=A0A285EE71_9ACTN|nr:acyl-CoA dehydrogenase family protein [Geodermatophilus sabuli]MBB3086343.1 putative acyl-CoA dehydrogenase [Geodermatophilus sabuli]SNX97442.1 putative acyl-CoA dehydrogenase [Geodermatophilus sabuli]